MNAGQKSGDIHEQLQALRDSYVTLLPERMADIEQDWKRQPSAAAPTEIHELYRKVHSMAGSAGTFGLPEIGREAHILETCLKPKLESAQDWSPAERASVDEGIARLRKLIELRTAQGQVDTLSPATDEEKAGGGAEAQKLVYLMEEDASRSSRLHSKLVHFGYCVETFHDRDVLAAAVRRKRPVALIMDFHTREMQEACTNWLIDYQLSQTAELPVIFIANATGFEVRLRAVRAGGFAYLEQPMDLAVLADRLDALTADSQPEPYRAVIVDDDRQLAQHIALVMMQAGIDTRVVNDPANLLDVLAEFQPDLTLMDLHMPECSGEELAKLIRQDISRVSMPIVFLSTETDQERQYSALMTGADEFVMKPIQDRQLVAIVKSRAQRARTLENAMSRDSLTGLLKHTKIKEGLEFELMRAHRQGASLSFAMLDIDFFKQVNDSHGHPMGDRVIKSLAHLLQQRLRQSDLIGRYGGEEFAVILPDTDVAGATVVMEAVRKAFGELEFNTESGTFSVTLSAGVVECGQCRDANVVTELADRALYDAKHAGRNRIIAKTIL